MRVLLSLRDDALSKLDRFKADMLATLERRLGEQTRWLFGAWAIVLGSVIGLWFRS